MAVVANQYNPNDPNQQQNMSNTADNSTGAPGSSGGDSSGPQGPVNVSGSQAQNNTNTAANTPHGTNSGRFSNITNYLKANQNYNRDNGGFAGQVAGNIRQQGNQVNQNLQDTNNQFNQQAQQNRIQYDPNAVQNTLQNATTAVNDPNQFNQFQKLRTGTYAGPTALTNDASLQSNVQNYQNLAGQAQNENGRFNVLRSMFDRPGYSSGQQKLDNLLIQSNPQQAGAFNAVNRQANQLNNTFNTDTNNAQLLGQTYQNEAKSTNNAVTNDLTNYNDQQLGTIDTQVQAAQAAKDARIKALQGELGSRTVTDADLNQLGLAPYRGSSLYNLDLNNYLNVDPSKANRQNVASADQYAQMNALAKLAGQTNGSADFNNSALANTFGNNQYNFDKDRFAADQKSAAATYNRTNSDLTNAYNQALGLTGHYHELLGGAGGSGARGNWLNAIASQGQNINSDDQQALGALRSFWAAQDALSKYQQGSGVSNTLGVSG